MDGKNGDKGGEKFASGKNSIHVHSKHPFQKLPSYVISVFSGTSAAGLLLCTR